MVSPLRAMVTSISLRAIDCSCVPGRFSRRLEPIQYRLLAPLCVEQPESTPAVELFFYPRPIVCNAATRPTHPVQRVVLPKASASLDHLPNPSPNTPVLSLAVASLRVPFCNANDLRSLYTCQCGSRERTSSVLGSSPGSVYHHGISPIPFARLEAALAVAPALPPNARW